MTDQYCHLDMDAESPIADIEQRMAEAKVSGALLVETWDGRNASFLRQTDKFSVALCYRSERRRELLQLMETGEIVGVRMTTAHIRSDKDFCREIAQSGKTLLAHAESGVGSLCRELRGLEKMKMYVPHMAWPQSDDWNSVLTEFASMPSLTIGISAIAHFSREPFPHEDVYRLAQTLIPLFPAERIVIGSDYPLFEKSRYGDYMRLAQHWVHTAA